MAKSWPEIEIRLQRAASRRGKPKKMKTNASKRSSGRNMLLFQTISTPKIRTRQGGGRSSLGTDR